MELVPQASAAEKFIQAKKMNPYYEKAYAEGALRLYKKTALKVREHIPRVEIDNAENPNASLLYQAARTKMAASIIILKAIKEEVSLN